MSDMSKLLSDMRKTPLGYPDTFASLPKIMRPNSEVFGFELKSGSK